MFNNGSNVECNHNLRERSWQANTLKLVWSCDLTTSSLSIVDDSCNFLVSLHVYMRVVVFLSRVSFKLYDNNNIGWLYFGLYENYCTCREWFSPRCTGLVNIIYDACSISSYNPQCHPILYNYFPQYHFVFVYYPMCTIYRVSKKYRPIFEASYLKILNHNTKLTTYKSKFRKRRLVKLIWYQI